MFRSKSVVQCPSNATVISSLRGCFPRSAGKDVITRLLDKKESTRLGSKSGASEVKQHKWFAKINWGLLRNTQPPVSSHSFSCYVRPAPQIRATREPRRSSHGTPPYRAHGWSNPVRWRARAELAHRCGAHAPRWWIGWPRGVYASLRRTTDSLAVGWLCTSGARAWVGMSEIDRPSGTRKLPKRGDPSGRIP